MLKVGSSPIPSGIGFSHRRNDRSASASAARVVFLTNFLPPYRSPVLRALSAHVHALKTFVSTKMEANRNWAADWDELDVDVQKCFTKKKLDKHPSGFTQETYVHLPYDTLPKLTKFRPDVVISGEMGARTIQAVLYRIAAPRSRLIIYADLSEHTELGRGRTRMLLRRWMVRHADAILVNGNSGARYVKSLGAPETKIFRVPYATDTSLYAGEMAIKECTQVTKLLHVGQLIERKGIVLFLHRLSAWAVNNSGRQLELILVGDGPLRASIEATNTPTNLKVTLITPMAYSEMPAIYAQADIFVLPTLADSWGLVVNEAMAAGLPILGSGKSQAVEELVQDGETGWIFNPDEPDDVESALGRALSEPRETRVEMGERARAAAIRVTAEVAAEAMIRAIDFCQISNLRNTN